MRRVLFFCAAILCAAGLARAQGHEQVLPAGMLLNCTLDEPMLSSRTLQVGDPIVCHVGAFSVFEQAALPQGGYLVGRFQEYRDPGRFFGKGWISLGFDRLLLPNTILPVTAKVISAPPLRADRQGRLHGTGHPRRDAIEWAFPLLWPIKTLTLPRRGPRPALKGEARVTLRLMEDLVVPSSPLMSLTSAAPEQEGLRASAPQEQRLIDRLYYAGSTVSDGAAGPQEDPVQPLLRPAPLTLLFLKSGAAEVAIAYWLQDSRLFYVRPGGTVAVMAFDALDLNRTVEENRERGVRFVPVSEPPRP